MTVPLLLFCDDTSGNTTKKWNKFVIWNVILAGATSYTQHTFCSYHLGLPQSEKNKLENIHFVACSNRVDAMTMAEPLVENLLQLENGIEVYDAFLEQNVIVVAPVMFIMADNPMSSDLCNHMGSTARKFCRMCLVSLNISHMPVELV